MINFRAGLFVSDIKIPFITPLHMKTDLFAFMLHVDLEKLKLGNIHCEKLKFCTVKVDLKIIDHGAKIEIEPSLISISRRNR